MDKVEDGKRKIKIEIGLRMKEVRQSIGMSQSELADKMKYYQSNICGIERGYSYPGMSLLRYLGETHNINMNWIIFGIGEMREKYAGYNGWNDYAEYDEEMKDLYFHLETVPQARREILKFFINYKHQNKKEICEYLKQTVKNSLL